MSSSFGNRSHRQLRVPERLRPRSSSSSSPPSSKPSSFSLDSEMEDIIYNHPSLSSSKALSLDQPSLMFSDGLDSADYFDLPSPPSTPMNPTHFGSLNDSILSSGGPPSPGLSTSSVSSCSTFSTPSSPGMSGGGSSGLHWPTVSQRINRLQLRSRSFSASSSSTSSPSHSRSGSISSAGSAAGQDALVSGMQGLSVQPTAATIRAARRTPYYPPNSSRTREAERQRVYMNRGPHYVPNWTPLGSLPRHVQLQIEERMDRFTAI